MSEAQCDCANMNGHMCYPCLEKDYYAISADNFRLVHDNQELLEIAKNLANEGKCYAYEDQWGMCVHSDCKWHSAEHAWESYCMRRGL